jgi:hypothetical protein
VHEPSAERRAVEKSRRSRYPGRVVGISMSDGRIAYGRQLLGVEVEFYDRLFADNEPVDLLDVVESPVAFRVLVMDRAFSRTGPWTLLDVVSLSVAERTAVSRYARKDVLGHVTIYWKDPANGSGGERAATAAECEGLERDAVWDPEHIEDRLRDHFAGRPNEWVESLRV